MLDRHLHNSRPFQLGFLVIVSSSWKLLNDCGDVRHTLSSTLEFCSVFLHNSCSKPQTFARHFDWWLFGICSNNISNDDIQIRSNMEFRHLGDLLWWPFSDCQVPGLHRMPDHEKGIRVSKLDDAPQALQNWSSSWARRRLLFFALFVWSISRDPFIWLRATRDAGWVTVEHGWTLSLNQRGDRRHWFECVNFNYRSNLGQLKRYRSECRFFKCCSLSEIVQM